jgi:hypothetical protein
MGIERVAGKYVVRMTEPGGWPDIDEQQLITRGVDLTRVLQQLNGVSLDWLHERAEIFGPAWSGGGANAADGAVGQRIRAMQDVQSALVKTISWYAVLVNLIASTKMVINSRLIQYEAELGELESKVLNGEAEPSEVDDKVKQALSENQDDVSAAKGRMPQFDTFKHPDHALEQLLRTPLPPMQPASTQPQHGSLPIDPPLTPPPSEQPELQLFAGGDQEGRTTTSTPEPPQGQPEIQPVHQDGGQEGDAATSAPEPTQSPPERQPVHQDGDTAPSTPETPLPPQPPAPGSPAPGGPLPGLPPTGGPSSAPSVPGTSGPTSPGRVGMPTSPLSGPSGSPSTPSVPSTANPAAAAAGPPTPAAEFERAMNEATKAAAAQPPMPPPQPLSAPAAAQPPAPPPLPDTPAAPPATQAPAASGPGAGGGGAAPAAPAPGGGAPAAPPMPLGPPSTPPPAAPVAAPGPTGPAVAPASAGAAGSLGAPAPVPVSARRAEREAIAAAATAGALRRRSGGNDPAQLARRIAAALNAGVSDVGFFWITGLAQDGIIVVANTYGLGYIPEGVNLPEQVKFVTADESIPAATRGGWATYPILALHGWAQHHNTTLRQVIGTDAQLKGFDLGAAMIVLEPDDIPDTGRMEGRSRLQVIAPDAAAQLAAVSDASLSEVLPPPSADTKPPDDQRSALWFEVFRPLLSSDPDRASAQLRAFVTYTEHAQDLALHRAHTATDAAAQRAAIADWIYWQHLNVLMSDAVAESVSS